jgi:putative endonuclease
MEFLELLMKDSKYYWIYILECKNSKYYTGYTNDVAKRYSLHTKGKGAKYTKSFKPIKIAQCWKLHDTIAQAMKIEAFIKQKPRIFKDNLVKNPNMLKDALYKKFGVNFKIFTVNYEKIKKIAGTLP